MIAIAIFFTNKNKIETAVPVIADQATQQTKAGVPAPVTEADYIRGNPNAPIVMIEYSDYDCPFCQQFHATMKQIMDEYGVTGHIAWVYRQYPLTQLHPNSPKISEAALCVGKLGGNEAFWKFTDTVYNSRNIDEATNVTRLPDFAGTAGISESDFVSCLTSGETKETLVASIEDGFNAGVRSTPYTVLTVGDQQAVISGAQPYEVVKGIVINLIDQLEGNFDTSTENVGSLPVTEQGVPLLE